MNTNEEPTPDLSIVIPVYRSAPGLPELADRISKVLDNMKLDWELLLVDDCSPDDSAAVIESLCAENPRIVGLLLARNHGQHYATLCGLKASRGQRVITMDDDLQNPPEEIPKLVDALHGDLQIVIAAHDQVKQGLFRRMTSSGMQFLLTTLLGKPKSLRVTSFRILTRKAADLMSQYQGVYPYLPSLMFNAVPVRHITNVALEHAPRAHGSSSYTLGQLVKLASFLVVNHSKLLLRLVVIAGVLISACAAIMTLIFIARFLIFQSQPVGWTSLAVLTTFFSGVIMISLGIIGEYIGRIIEQTDKVQTYQVFRTINR